jgi:hypothetical protein
MPASACSASAAYASPFLMIIPDAKMITLGEDAIFIRTELASAARPALSGPAVEQLQAVAVDRTLRS